MKEGVKHVKLLQTMLFASDICTTALCNCVSYLKIGCQRVKPVLCCKGGGSYASVNFRGSSCTQLTELTLNLLKRRIAGGFTPMQPSLDLGARMLTALVLHVITAVFSKQRDPLLKPFVSILTTPTTMVVSHTRPLQTLG